MVISANSKLDVFHNEYIPFLELFRAPAFRIFTGRSQQKVVVYDLASREYCFVSDALNIDGHATLPTEGPLLRAWACMNKASLVILENEFLPMLLRICKKNPQELARLYFEATVQLNDMSWSTLHCYPLCLNNDHSSVLVSSILAEAPMASKPNGVQCSAYMVKGQHTALLLSLGEEPDKGQALGLSKRELEVLHLLCKGKTSRTISEQLFVSFETVKKHRQNILEKTGCKNTVELMNLAMSLGII